MNDYSNIKTVNDILKIKRKDITQSLLRYLFAVTEKDKKSRFNPAQKVTLNKNQYYNNSEIIKTCIGNYLINYFLFNEKIFNVIGFINQRFSNDTIEDINDAISENLLNDKLDTKSVVDYLNRIQFLGFSMDSTVSASMSEKTMFALKSVEKRKKELAKQYKKEIEAGDVNTTVKIEKELLKIAKDELKGDYGMDIFDSGAKPSFNNNYKLMNIMKGSIHDADGTYNTSLDNYNDGVSKKDSHLFANAQIDGQYNKSVGTQDGGYIVKRYLGAFQSVILDEKGSDCGTQKTVSIIINKFNKKLLKYRYMKKGSQKILLTPELLDSLVDRSIELYDPIYCMGDYICNKCAGDLMYKLGIKNAGITASRMGSTILNRKMKKFHDNTLKLYEVTNLDELIL